MTYRVRRQFWTGKLILQTDVYGDGWRDALGAPDPEFAFVSRTELKALQARAIRADKADRRAEGQRKANAARKAAVEPSE